MEAEQPNEDSSEIIICHVHFSIEMEIYKQF